MEFNCFKIDIFCDLDVNCSSDIKFGIIFCRIISFIGLRSGSINAIRTGQCDLIGENVGIMGQNWMSIRHNRGVMNSRNSVDNRSYLTDRINETILIIVFGESLKIDILKIDIQFSWSFVTMEQNSIFRNKRNKREIKVIHVPSSLSLLLREVLQQNARVRKRHQRSPRTWTEARIVRWSKPQKDKSEK